MQPDMVTTANFHATATWFYRVTLALLLAAWVAAQGPIDLTQHSAPGDAPGPGETEIIEKAILLLEHAARYPGAAGHEGAKLASEHAAIILRNKLAQGRIRCFTVPVRKGVIPGPTKVAETFPDRETGFGGGVVFTLTANPGNWIWINRAFKDPDNPPSSIFLASYLLHEAIHCIQEGELPGPGGPIPQPGHFEVEAYCWQLKWIEYVAQIAWSVFYPPPIPWNFKDDRNLFEFGLPASEQSLHAGVAEAKRYYEGQ